MAQEVAPQCEQFLATCINKTDAIYANPIGNYPAAAICAALATTLGCYNTAAGRPECAPFHNTLSALNSSASEDAQLMCPNGQPSACLGSLKQCVDTYNGATSTSATTLSSKCTAAETADACLTATSCSGELATLQLKFIQTVTNITTISNCITSNPNATECERRAANCLTPIESKLQEYEQNYNFNALCTEILEGQKCFSNLQRVDANCSYAKQNLTLQMNKLNNRYSQYCDNTTNSPKPCMQTLASCTTSYSDLSNLPQYKANDPLLYCQGMKSLVVCLKPLASQITVCPALASVQAISSRQQEEAEVEESCSAVLTSCTQTPAQCIVDQSLKIQFAEIEDKWDKVCHYAGDFRKCLDPYLSSPQCQQGSGDTALLQAELVYIQNLTALVCDPMNPQQALPCLKKVHICATSFLTKVESQGVATNANFCGDSVKLGQCLDGVTCPQNLQKYILASRQKAKNECSSSGGTSLALSLTLMMFVILKVILVKCL